MSPDITTTDWPSPRSPIEEEVHHTGDEPQVMGAIGAYDESSGRPGDDCVTAEPRLQRRFPDA
jgi:hypothetical protein